MNKDNINMSELYPSGYLEVIIGPMFSSKTTRLVEVYKQCQFCNISVAVINHSIDNRYDDDLMSTHDKVKIPCIKTDKLMDLWIDSVNLEETVDDIPRVKDKFKIGMSNVILINEGQFFKDLYQFTKNALEQKKTIYISHIYTKLIL